jgi:hypothetical protein
MRKPSTRRPSPALVIAMLALFVALGGTGYAAATGSIDGREIKNNTISTNDIRSNTVRGSDVRTNTLTGSDISETRLGKVPSASKADSATSATSAANAAAVGGVAPGRLVRDYEYLTASSTDPGASKQVFINCPAGKNVIGGGTAVQGTDAAYVAVDRPISTVPGTAPNQWFGQGEALDGTDTNFTVSATVICATVR